MRNKQSGYGVLIFFLMAAMLGAVLAASLSGGSSVASMMSNNNASQMIAAQASLIRTRLLQCSNENPTGNNGGSFRLTFPRADTATLVSALTCPGNALGLWSWSDGVSIPGTVSGFGPWYYVNDATSMRITVASTISDRASIVPNIVSILGAQASQSGTTPTITLSWVLAN